MAEYIQRPFAENGLKQDIAVDTTVDGTVSYQSGWTEKYGIDPAVDPANAKFPDLKDFNKLNYNITSNIKEWQEQTFPNWIADKGDGNPFEYSEGAVVRYTDGKNYVSTMDNNDGEPSVDSGWVIFDISLKAPIASPTFTGTQTLPRAVARYNDADRVFTIGTSTADAVYEYIDPSGTIVGKNSNGSYWKYVDGKLVCTQNKVHLDIAATIAYGGLFRSNNIQFTYPVSFTAVDVISYGYSGGNVVSCINGGPLGLVDVNFQILTAISEISIYRVIIEVVGRWKA